MKLLVTADIEGTGQQPNCYESVDIFDDFIKQVDFRLVLFVTPDVVEHRTEMIARWRSMGHDVGLHIHPARLAEGGSDRLAEYDAPGIRALLDHGLKAFEAELDYRPTTFRAGRWEYSDRLLRVLSEHDFVYDASLRCVDHDRPYTRWGVYELPMTVYANPLIRSALSRREIGGIPLHADAFVTTRLHESVLYATTWRLLQTDRPYLMVSLHDYDLLAERHRNRIRRYLNWIASRISTERLEAIDIDNHGDYKKPDGVETHRVDNGPTGDA